MIVREWQELSIRRRFAGTHARRLVQVSGEKPARFVREQWIDSRRDLAGQMVVNDLVGQREAFSLFPLDLTRNSIA